MALIVEDGSGLSNAESFISVADANTYFTNRGITAWTGSDAVKEQALRKATDYMQGRYGRRWKGTRKFDSQALAWPRVGVLDADDYSVSDTIVPTPVKYACAELAVRSLTTSLLPDDTAPGIKSESVSIPGPISKSVSYTGSKSKTPYFPVVDDLVRQYMISNDYAERA